jgi:hypothetical protein
MMSSRPPCTAPSIRRYPSRRRPPPSPAAAVPPPRARSRPPRNRTPALSNMSFKPTSGSASTALKAINFCFPTYFGTVDLAPPDQPDTVLKGIVVRGSIISARLHDPVSGSFEDIESSTRGGNVVLSDSFGTGNESYHFTCHVHYARRRGGRV